MGRVFKEDMYILGLLNIYTASNRSLSTISYEKLNKYYEVVEQNLESENSKTNCLKAVIFSEEMNYYTISRGIDSKSYFTLNNESTVLKTILVRKGLLPIDVLCASMQDNALECLGLQIKEGHICRKEKYHTGIVSTSTTFMRQFIDKLKSGELKIETCPQVEVESEFTREYIIEQLESYQRLLDSEIIEETTKEKQGPVKKLVPNNKK